MFTPSLMQSANQSSAQMCFLQTDGLSVRHGVIPMLTVYFQFNLHEVLLVVI